MRIAKYLAHSGLQSRRQCENLIRDGLISVDGQIVTDLSYKVKDKQVVKYKNKIITLISKPSIWIFHKPVGFLCSTVSQKNHPTIYSIIPREIGNVISVGRLDLNSQGIILLTNNGDLARHLELPKSEYKRCYKVRIFGKIPPSMIPRLEKGITINKIRYGKMEVKLLNKASIDSKNQYISITLTEGRNREIRKVMEFFGLQVSKLIRTSYAGLELGKVEVGQTKFIPYAKWSKLISWRE